MQPIIQARNVAKQYHLGGQPMPSRNFREVMVNSLMAPLKRLRSADGRGSDETFWALDDVSFDIKPGEAVGVIGRNGAGKSTLLKVLSRITEPTRGRIELRGRASSLLEVGTGFHPELTGRENIYLNGTILGMRKHEIDRKFDEIVAFAEVERFVDTPVKRYSSGMYVRLAFAVAAHLEPEILIIDEVLAVGDAEFQRKCLGKMSDVAHEGRTVLFVSHNMAAMRALCTRALVLKRGKLEFDGPIEAGIGQYLAMAHAARQEGSYRLRGRRVTIERTELFSDGNPVETVMAGEPATIRVHYRTLDPAAVGGRLQVELMLYIDGQKLTRLETKSRDGAGIELAPQGWVDCHIPRWPFRSKQMRLDIYTHLAMEPQDWIEEALSFASNDGDFYGTGTIPETSEGVFFLDHDWSSGIASEAAAAAAAGSGAAA